MATAYDDPVAIVAFIDREKVDMCARTFLWRNGAMQLGEENDPEILSNCQQFRNNIEKALTKNNVKFSYCQIIHDILTARQPENRGKEIVITVLFQKQTSIRSIGVLISTLILSSNIESFFRKAINHISNDFE